MKKLICFYLAGFMFFGQICYSQSQSQQMGYNDYLLKKCPACQDKLLIELKEKDTLSLQEKQLYAALQQNCEICIASALQVLAVNEQNRLIKEQTQTIKDKPNASTPLWFVIIAGFLAAIVLTVGSKK